jgi:hypothetical protein
MLAFWQERATSSFIPLALARTYRTEHRFPVSNLQSPVSSFQFLFSSLRARFLAEVRGEQQGPGMDPFG